MFLENTRDEDKRGKLYVVATPIGNLEDITLRAKSLLASVSWIACEDTRHSSKLLHALGIHTKLIALHAHNENDEGVIGQFIQRLEEGDTAVLISDAGTPLISDPGLPLVRLARERGIPVIPVPGACAFVAALSAMGLPCDRFSFEGFLPVKTVARQKILQKLKEVGQTVIFYEAPHRIQEVITEMAEIFGRARPAGIAREITKKFEQIVVGNLGELSDQLVDNRIPQMGEFVVVIGPQKKNRVVSVEKDGAEIGEEPQIIQLSLDNILKVFLATMPLKEAVRLTKELTGLSKNILYNRALELSAKPE